MAKKSNNWLIAIVIITAVLLLTGAVSIPNIKLPDFSHLFGGSVNSGLVDVNKQLKYTLIDTYAGSARASLSNVLSVYDSDGETILESNLDTDSSGQGNTAFSYSSGKVIYFKYESSNDKQWFPITIPQMNTQDAEAATYNLIELRTFQIGTYTSDRLQYGATEVTDGANYNVTLTGTTQTYTYSLANTGSDNTGLMTSYDPLYKMNWNVVQYVKVSGTGYERVLFYGFESDYTLGTTHYLASNLDAYKLTKHKVGNEYRSTGTNDLTFSIDATGIIHGDSVTVQLYTYVYSDYGYMAAHGASYGPEAVQIAESTMILIE
jgi:hypothetical protein